MGLLSAVLFRSNGIPIKFTVFLSNSLTFWYTKKSPINPPNTMANDIEENESHSINTLKRAYDNVNPTSKYIVTFDRVIYEESKTSNSSFNTVFEFIKYDDESVKR